MKIKIAILEKDVTYLQRLVSAFSIKYSDKIELYSFTNVEVALDILETSKIDVFLANTFFEINRKDIPARCAFAYLVDSNDIETVRGEVAVSKFQKADLIYKQILSIFSENSSAITGIHFDENEKTKVVAFLSPAGGTGCSTAAAAYAMNLAHKRQKILYLNLEMLGVADAFFEAEGTSDFSDIIYAIKSKKSNMSLKLESAVKQDSSGVFFYSSTKMVLDMIELNGAELKKLVTDLKLFGGYDCIILDLDFSVSKDTLELLKDCSKIVFVSDGLDVSNVKLERAIEAIKIIDEQSEMRLMIRSGILYNRVSSKISKKPNVTDVKEYGGIKRYEGYGPRQMIEEIAKLAVFDTLA